MAESLPSTTSEKEISTDPSDEALKRLFNSFFRGDIMLALGVVAILVVLILPMPTWALDISLAFSITFSVLVLMTALFV